MELQDPRVIPIQWDGGSWCKELHDPSVIPIHDPNAIPIQRDAGSRCKQLHDPSVFLMKSDARSWFTGLHNPNPALPSPPAPSLLS